MGAPVFYRSLEDIDASAASLGRLADSPQTADGTGKEARAHAVANFGQPTESCRATKQFTRGWPTTDDWESSTGSAARPIIRGHAFEVASFACSHLPCGLSCALARPASDRFVVY